MTVVATLSQTMRAQQCASYMSALSSVDRSYIIISDPSALSPYDLPANCVVIPVKPAPDLLPTSRLMKSRLRQRIIAFARGGSQMGQKVEKYSRRILWRLRYLDRLIVAASKSESDANGKISEPLLELLQQIHTDETITQVVVFDLFDLPTALKFGVKHSARVMVR